MKKSKILAALLTLGLAVAATTPALALENEFHGMFGARYDNSNFNGTPTTDFNAAGGGQYDPTGAPRKLYSANYVEQRARIQYIAKANADLKLVTHFEIDYNFWGNSSYTVARGGGGALGADTVNIETKSIYLDANPGDLNMRLGMQPNNDAFKGVLFDADMAGILLSSSYGSFTPSFGVFRFFDKGAIKNVLGHNTADMVQLDGKFEVSKNLKVGAAYYFFRDSQITDPVSFAANDVKMNVLGLNAEYATGPLTLNGFAVLEAGTVNTRSTSAWALNAGAKLKVGPGTARSEFLYVSGDKNTTGHSNAFFALNGEHGYYDNEMVILGRDKNAFFTIDNSIIYNSGNGGQGQIGGYLGYDLPINDKLTTAVNAGFAAVAKDTQQTHASNYLGTEINAEANYKMMDNLTTSIRVGYVILGDYFKNQALNGTPVNPYDASLIFKYTF